MSIQATYKAELTVIETLAAGVAFGTDKNVTHEHKTSKTLNATSSPTGTDTVAFQKALAAGAGTIDLTALPIAGGGTLNGTGKRLRAGKFSNPSGNANPISIFTGVTNGYNFSGADGKLTLSPGQEALLYWDDDGDAIGASDKTLDLTGSGTQALDVVLILG